MPIDRDALEQSLGRVPPAGGDLPVEEVLRAVAEAMLAVFQVSGAGLMLIDSGQALRYVVSTDEPGRVLEESQEEVGEGPCVQAFVLDEIVSTPDVCSDERWPKLRPLLEGHRVRAVLGVPVHMAGGAVGSLDAYKDEPFEWDQSYVDAIRAYARVMEAVLAASVNARQQSAVVDQLQYALDNRVVIERAIGVLMGRDALDAVAAFNRLRQASRRSRRRVGEVAAAFLAGEPLEGDR